MHDLLLGHGRRPPSKSVAPRAVPIGEGRLFRHGSYSECQCFAASASSWESDFGLRPAVLVTLKSTSSW